MKKISFLFFIFITLISYAIEYDVISVTNSNGEVKDIKIQRIDTVRNIYEIRDFNLIEKLSKLDSNIYIHKLDPIKIISIENINELDTDDINIKYLDTQDIKIASLDTEDINITKLNTKKFVVVVDQSTFQYLDELKKITLYENKYDTDYLSSMYLKDFKNVSDYLKSRWINALSNNSQCNIRYIRNRTRYKIVGEVFLINDTYDKDLLDINLNFLKQKGYDSILVRYNCTENISKLVELMEYIHSKGFNLYCVYCGLDNQKPAWNPFSIDNYTIENYMSSIIPLCQGMFLNWRTTSGHTKFLPIEFFNYLCNTARSYNDSLLIYGEIYYGRLDPSNTKKGLIKTIPNNITGIVINNMGYNGYNHSYIANKLFSKVVSNYGKLDKIGQVIGYQPYYCSRNDLKLNLDEEYNYKKDIESSYKKANCSSVTMLHDGIDDNFSLEKVYETTDNILYDTKIKEHLINTGL